jgi:ATPase subunit of ABC transporter with duplicated ATPase domains
MISFYNVSKSFAKQDILLDCSFQVNAGERVGIIGANGSGKSTVFKLLLETQEPSPGLSPPRCPSFSWQDGSGTSHRCGGGSSNN